MLRYSVPAIGFLVVGALASVLIGVIVLRSPDTHSNLWETVRAGYDRTPLSFIGPEVGEVRLSTGELDAGGGAKGLISSAFAAYTGDPDRAVYLSRGCATCHGLDARGGPVGPSLAGVSPDVVRHMVREGPRGMPTYTEANLGDADLKQLTGYLRGLPVDRPDSQRIAGLNRLTYNAAVPVDVLLRGKAAVRRSCGGCHEQPGIKDILATSRSDAEVVQLVADMAQDTNLSLEEAEAVAYYMLAVRNGADPVKTP